MRLTPIGTVRSRYQRLAGMPLQAVAGAESAARVEILPAFAAGLKHIAGFSHLHLLSWLHRAPAVDRLEVVPFLDDEPRGVFATRSPNRPNPIGLSVVRLLGVEGSSLRIAGVDLLDGTPVLDSKPHVPSFDRVEAEQIGWFEGRDLLVHERRSDRRFDPD